MTVDQTYKKQNKIAGNMETKVKVTALYSCTLERAFKSPILCDVSKIHTGFGIMPRVTHCTDDEDWGQAGGSKKVFMAKSLTQKGGFASIDRVVERIENEYWKIEVSDFQSWMLGFHTFVGEWKTTELSTDSVLIEYTYTLQADMPALYPLQWLFTKIFWRAYMKKVLENIRQLTLKEEPYQYA